MYVNSFFTSDVICNVYGLLSRISDIFKYIYIYIYIHMCILSKYIYLDKRLLSVSVLAWPFVVINRKVYSAEFKFVRRV